MAVSCQPWSQCSAGFHKAGGSSTSDGNCVACSPGTFTSSPNLDATCQVHSSCSTGTYLSTLGTATADAQCIPCPNGTYQDAIAHSLLACKAKSTCAPGFFAADDGDAAINRRCGPCLAGSYTPANNTQLECLLCPPGSAGVGDQAFACTVSYCLEDVAKVQSLLLPSPSVKLLALHSQASLRALATSVQYLQRYLLLT